MQIVSLALPFFAVASGYSLASGVGSSPAAVSRASVPKLAASPLAADIWSTTPSVRVQGNTLKTWDLGDQTVERVQLSIKSEGRPIDSNVELWYTPSYEPLKVHVYSEDGALRPINAVIETPQNPKSVAVYNSASMDFPFDATVAKTGLAKAEDSLPAGEGEHIQGGQITSYTFGPEVKSVQCLIKTDARNMKAKIELTQGPNQVKQYVELYAQRGFKNPFYVVIQTPGSFNTVRVLNQNPVEFPLDAWVVPYETGNENDGPVIPNGGGWGR